MDCGGGGDRQQTDRQIDSDRDTDRRTEREQAVYVCGRDTVSGLLKIRQY
jgi:hypothetical protein